MARVGGNPEIYGYKKDYYTDKVLPKWDMIGGWCRAGLSDQQLAEKIGIGTTTVKRFLEEHEEFADWVREAREDAEVQIENALFKRATGYEYEEVTKERREVDGRYKLVVTKKVLKQVQPDVGAQQYWLEHRAPNKWTRNPAPGTDVDKINEGIASIAALIANPVPVREIGDENI